MKIGEPGRVIGLLTAAMLLCGMLPSSAQAWCWWNCSYAKTKYPIVLAHGFLGADS